MTGTIGKSHRPNVAQATRPGIPCSNGCGREVNPGPASLSFREKNARGDTVIVTPTATCIFCIAETARIARPRMRRLIRGGALLGQAGGVSRRSRRVALRQLRQYGEQKRQVVARLDLAIRRADDHNHAEARKAGQARRAA